MYYPIFIDNFSKFLGNIIYKLSNSSLRKIFPKNISLLYKEFKSIINYYVIIFF